MDNISPKAAVAYLYLAMAQVMVAINIVGSKFLVQHYSMFFLLCTRFFIATIFLVIGHYVRKFRKTIVKKARIRDLTTQDWFFLAAQGICGGVLVNYLLLYGLHYTNANSAGIITSALPAVVTVFSIIFLRERLTFPLMISITLAVFGLIVMNFGKWHSGAFSGLYGDFIIMLSLLPEAGYYMFAKLHENRLPIFVFSALINAINFVVTFIVMLALSHVPTGAIPLKELVVLFIVGLTSGFFYIFWYLGCKHVSGIMAALVTVALPIATILISWVFLKETVTVIQLTGMALVGLSILFTALRNPLFRLFRQQS